MTEGLTRVMVNEVQTANVIDAIVQWPKWLDARSPSSDKIEAVNGSTPEHPFISVDGE